MKTVELDFAAMNSIAVEAGTSGLPGAALLMSAVIPFSPGDGGTERVAEEESGVDAPVEVSTVMVEGTATMRGRRELL